MLRAEVPSASGSSSSDGALGRVYQLRQCEKHSGPHRTGSTTSIASGGGVLMDMGCHALAWFRWMLGGNPQVESVYATMCTVLHRGDRRARTTSSRLSSSRAASSASPRTAGPSRAAWTIASRSTARAASPTPTCSPGNAALTYSEAGYGYALEKAGSTRGWTFTVFEEAFNQGYPQELQHFVDCVRRRSTPLVTGEDGRAVLEMIYAAYESAGLGRKVVPAARRGVARPIDCAQGQQSSASDESSRVGA